MHYDIRVTPKVYADAGFKYDSTLGFNDNVGFRFGTCYPWKFYDLKAEEKLPMLEIPLIMQDGALLLPQKGLRLDKKTALEYITVVANAVEKVGGVLTLLWHPHFIIKQEWWDLYLKTLKYLSGENPWFVSVKEIGEWWENSSREYAND